MKIFTVILAACVALIAGAPSQAALLGFDASNAVSPPRGEDGRVSNHSFYFNNQTFSFRNGRFIYDDTSGFAELRGLARADDDPAQGLRIRLFFNAVDWTTSRQPKIEVPQSELDAAGINPVRDWQAFELIESGPNNSFIQVVGNFVHNVRGQTNNVTFGNGEILDVVSKPFDGSHVFQMGEGANGKNLNFGMSGWFAFTNDGEEFCGERQICDGNLDFSFTGIIPLPATALLLLGGLAVLVGFRRKA